MQLVVPKRKDIRLYAMFSERAFQVNDVPSLLWYMRNARSHVEQIVSDTQVKLSPVMGGNGSQLKLTRIGNLGVMPDFKSDAAFLRTMIPIPTGYDSTGRCNSVNEGKFIKDGASPFSMTKYAISMMASGPLASFIPDRVGQYTIQNTNWTLPQMYSTISYGQFVSYSGNMYENMALLRSTTDTVYQPIVSTHPSDSQISPRPIYNNINADTGSVMLMWGANFEITGNSRFQLPTKDASVPTVPGANLVINEPSINISACVIPMQWGNEIRVYKLQQLVDFTAYSQAVGSTPTLSMAKIDLPFDEVISV